MTLDSGLALAAGLPVCQGGRGWAQSPAGALPLGALSRPHRTVPPRLRHRAKVLLPGSTVGTAVQGAIPDTASHLHAGHWKD